MADVLWSSLHFEAAGLSTLSLAKGDSTMASPRKIAANRKNSTRSTGPKTTYGKARSAANSVKHGLASMKPILISGEDPTEFEIYLAGYEEDLLPVGVVEMSLVHRLAFIGWRLKRAERMEGELLERATHEEILEQIQGPAIPNFKLPARLGAELMPNLSPEELEILRKRAGESQRLISRMSVGSSFARLSSGGDLFGRLIRYESALERSFYRTLHELERIQRRRLGEAVDAPAVVDVDVRTDVGVDPATSNSEAGYAVHLEPTQAIQPPEGTAGQEEGDLPAPEIEGQSEMLAERNPAQQPEKNLETNPPVPEEQSPGETSSADGAEQTAAPPRAAIPAPVATAPKSETKPTLTPAYRPNRHAFGREAVS